jgi:hypothetical protein
MVMTDLVRKGNRRGWFLISSHPCNCLIDRGLRTQVYCPVSIVHRAYCPDLPRHAGGGRILTTIEYAHPLFISLVARPCPMVSDVNCEDPTRRHGCTKALRVPSNLGARRQRQPGPKSVPYRVARSAAGRSLGCLGGTSEGGGACGLLVHSSTL